MSKAHSLQFGILLRKKVRAMLLGHIQEHAMYNTYYLRNIANLSVVPLILGDVCNINNIQKVYRYYYYHIVD